MTTRRVTNAARGLLFSGRFQRKWHWIKPLARVRLPRHSLADQVGLSPKGASATVFVMKGIVVMPPKKSKQFAAAQTIKTTGKTKPKRTVTFTVSRLTKPWALKHTENIIRALSGSALDGVDVRVRIGDSKPEQKRKSV